MATILLSTGATLATGLNPATTRQAVMGNGNVVESPAGYCNLVTPGTSGWDTVQSKNPTIDALFQAATSLAPLKLGVDDVFFTPLQYPEPAAL